MTYLSAAIEGIYQDGVHPRGVPAMITIEAQTTEGNKVTSQRMLRLYLPLGLDGLSPAYSRRYPIKAIDFGEPTERGTRWLRFNDGGQFSASDPLALNTYLSEHGQGGGWVSRITLKWRWVAVSLASIVAACVMLYTHGVPAFARWGAPQVPVAVTKLMGDQVFEQLEKSQFKPSKLSEAQQQAIRVRWEQFLARQAATQTIPAHTLYFRSMPLALPSVEAPDLIKHSEKNMADESADSPAKQTKSAKPPPATKTIELPNAMALPNGAIVLTDGLVNMLADKPDAVMGVLAHELGHLQHHHSMRLLIEVSALSSLSALILGDVSGFLAQAPLLLGVLSYSREHESQADDTAIAMMRGAGVSSAELAVFFERARDFMTVSAKHDNGKHKGRDEDKDRAKDKGMETGKDSGKDAGKDTGRNQAPDTKGGFSLPDWLSTHPSDAARIEKLKRQ